MLSIVKDYLRFTNTFGIKRGFHTTLLISGGIVASLLELTGLSILLPLINIIMQPDYMHTNAFMRYVSSLTNITQPSHMTMLVGFSIAMVFIIKNIFMMAYLSYENRILTNWRIHITTRLYNAFLSSDYELFMRRSSGHMINILDQVIPQVVNNFAYRFINLINYLFTGLIILFFIILVNWWVALLILTFGVLLAVVYLKVFRKMAHQASQTTLGLHKIQHSLLQQAFAGYKETQSHLKENIFTRKFEDTARNLAQSDGRLFFIENLPLALAETMIMVLLVSIFVLVTLNGSDITKAMTQVGVIIFASLRLVPVINRSLVNIMMLNNGTRALRYLFEELEHFRLNASFFTKIAKPAALPDTDITPIPFTQKIVFKNLNYTYPETAHKVLHNINLTIHAGEFIGITGPSGSGKSTLSGILMGFLSTYEGSFTVDHERITPQNIRQVRKISGFVDQHIFITETSIAENVAYGISPDKIDRSHVEEALRKAQLWEFVKKLPKGMDTHVGENGKLLSGGQRQRLAIARALFRNLKILILDEASSALDIKTEREFFATLQKLKGDLTVIMIAHRLSTLEKCDRVLFLENGSITATGSLEKLSRENKAFKRYIKSPDLKNEGRNNIS